jgi:hypothetical protein
MSRYENRTFEKREMNELHKTRESARTTQRSSLQGGIRVETGGTTSESSAGWCMSADLFAIG